MSISSEVRKAGPFAGNDVATSFQFAFKVFSTSDVLVVEANALGAESTLDLGTDYTVSLNADQNASPGGTVTLSAALATGKKLVLSSQVAQLQPVDLTNSGGFYPDVINKALDRATIQIQQLAEKVDRAIKVTLTSGLTPDEFVEELQQGASDASASAAAAAASAAAAAASAAAAATFDPDLYQLKAYGTGTVADALDNLESVTQTLGDSVLGVSQTLDDSVFGVSQSWTTVTRLNGVTYTNTTGRPIIVQAAATASSTSAAIGAFIGGSRAAISSYSTAPTGLGFCVVVPNGTSYSIDWTEGIVSGVVIREYR